MAKQLSDIKKLIERGETDTAINALTNFIGNHQGSKDEAYYLLGNAYRKKGDWQQALNNYLEAIERNPESPAVQSKVSRQLMYSIFSSLAASEVLHLSYCAYLSATLG